MEEKDREVEIDLLKSGKKLWNNRKIIIKITIVGVIFGLIIAFSVPKEYTASVVINQDISASSASGSMNSLAALAGINLGSPGTTVISPELYPDIFSSTPFLKGLFDIRVQDYETSVDTTLYVYLKDMQKSSWWKALGGVFTLFTKNNDSDKLVGDWVNERIISQDEMTILFSIKERINVNTQSKTNLTTVSVKMQSPEIAAYLADTITLYLQEYIINYRTQKARKDLEYFTKLYNESKMNYYTSQKELADFIDRNQNIVSVKYRSTQDRLQNEVNLSFSIYNQMAQQLQAAKIRVQDTTPILTIIQPSIQPLYPSSLSRKIIVVLFTLLAFMSISVWVLREDLWLLLNSQKQ